MVYTKEVREAALKLMLENDLSLRQISQEIGVPRGTLHSWKKKYMMRNKPTEIKRQTENWSAEEKFAVVIHTATLSEVDLNVYCRENGLYPDQIKAWRNGCIRGNLIQAKNEHRTTIYRKSKRKIQELELELKRKEKVLVELTALVILRKKFGALWEGEEED